VTHNSSIFQANAHDILNTYFIKYLLHVSVCYTLSSGRTSYYVLKTITSLTENVVHIRCSFSSEILSASRNATRHRCTCSSDHIRRGNACVLGPSFVPWRGESEGHKPALAELPDTSWNLHTAIHKF